MAAGAQLRRRRARGQPRHRGHRRVVGQPGQRPVRVPVAVGCTAVSAPKYYAYLRRRPDDRAARAGSRAPRSTSSCCCDGYPATRAGLRRAGAIYHRDAGAWTSSRSIHVIIIAFIIFGNVVYFLSRRGASARRGRSDGGDRCGDHRHLDRGLPHALHLQLPLQGQPVLPLRREPLRRASRSATTSGSAGQQHARAQPDQPAGRSDFARATAHLLIPPAPRAQPLHALHPAHRLDGAHLAGGLRRLLHRASTWCRSCTARSCRRSATMVDPAGAGGGALDRRSTT